MTNKITYEFPLNERIRVFIRLEQLFKQFNHFATGVSVWDKRAALNVLLDIMSIFSRNDLKSELLKELDRQGKALSRLSHSQGVDIEKLDQLLKSVSQISKNLYASSGKIGVHVMESDLFQSIAQRSSIPGGTCSFDLPEFHYWLEQDESIRLKDLQQWSIPFNDIRNAIDLTLNLIRNSSHDRQESATAGFFQISLDRSQPYQLLKVSLDKQLCYFAEISGGKHRCTIRFMEPSHDEKRPVQSRDDVPFTLSCCQFG
ncbi:cell division protein ZapD [Methylomicrobium sp. Wu6]|uniref:cell division protein ZapD n=1 Tax=Methylomicrobium sp. Wu6 TaxID=3107928 RepID=UPI002DD6213D|nr:cell division protein ZapD [Methylomicrobium sp. Wu6]MEC4748690.1 cell division protein ZapD [Methylomicrobium sp. Wu6]